MLTEDFRRYFRDTYTIGVYRYTTKAYNDIIKWDGWNQNTEEIYKKILRQIKNEKGCQDNNPKIKNGKYLSKLISGKNYMTIYFGQLEGFTDTVYFIYDFKIGKCPNL
jgi:hypothetical protein